MQNKTMSATRQFSTNWSVPASQPHPAPQQGFADVAEHSEIWVETKASGGEDKYYYYNVKTRETTWTRPDGPNIKIMQQSQVDLLAKTAMGPVASGAPPAAFSMPPPFGMPPPGAWPPNPGPWPNAGAPPGLPPPWASATPGGPPPPAMLAAVAKKIYPNDALIMSKVDKKILEAAADWTEHRAPDGRFYFYHTKRGDSVWEKPSALRDLELAKAAVAQALSVINKEPPGTNKIADFAPNANNVQRNNNRSAAAGAAGAVAVTPPGQGAAIAKKPQTADKSKPVQSTPVPGTPWCVVWTGDGRVFFYNPSTKTSIWERPEELIGRNEVDKLVSTPPPSVTVDASSSATAAAAAAAVAARLTAAAKTSTTDTAAVTVRKRARTENDSDASSDNDSDHEPDMKRTRSDLFTGARSNADSGRQSQHVSKIDTCNNDAGEVLMAPGTSDLTLPTSTEPSSGQSVEDVSATAAAATTENGHANAVDMEVQAARDRATLPLDDRIKSFREMLVEKDVSAFGTWEKELHKIVFDRRYLLLTSRERKQVFERYVKDRAEEERKEKRQKIKEKRDAFKKLLTDANLTGKSSFNDFVHRYGKDERYRNIEKLREREELFMDHVTNLRRKEKEDKIQRRETARKDFTDMLKEFTEIERYSHWIDVKKRFESDARYRAVESSSMRELWFKDYCRTLPIPSYKDERKKSKEQRSRTVDNHHHHHHRGSDKDKNKDNKDKDDRKSHRESKKSDVDVSEETSGSKRDKNKDGKKSSSKSSKSKSSGSSSNKKNEDGNSSVNGEVAVKKDGDSGVVVENGDSNAMPSDEINGRAVEDDDDDGDGDDDDGDGDEEEEGCIADSDDDDVAVADTGSDSRPNLVDYELEDGEDVSDEREMDEAEREKRARTEASLREREKEVQRTLASHLRDRDKEREQHQQSEAVEQFKALLVDCVRSSDVTWKEAKKSMKKDVARWQLVEILSRDDRDRFFNDHLDHLFRKKREKFRELLDETSRFSTGAAWKDVKKAIKDDPRYTKFGSSEKCEREFRDYVRDRANQEKHDFRELLAETKSLTHKSLESLADKSDAYLQEIEEVLKKDQRYLKMDYIPSERRQLIVQYIEDLAKKGPPPPPTATTDKARRLK